MLQFVPCNYKGVCAIANIETSEKLDTFRASSLIGNLTLIADEILKRAMNIILQGYFAINSRAMMYNLS